MDLHGSEGTLQAFADMSIAIEKAGLHCGTEVSIRVAQVVDLVSVTSLSFALLLPLGGIRVKHEWGSSGSAKKA